LGDFEVKLIYRMQPFKLVSYQVGRLIMKPTVVKAVIILLVVNLLARLLKLTLVHLLFFPVKEVNILFCHLGLTKYL